MVGWYTNNLRELVTINSGKSPAGILSETGDYPVVGTGGTERLGDSYLHDGDSIILGRKGTIDRVYYVTGKFWTIDTAYFLSDFNNALPIWLFYFLETIDFRQLNEATGVPSLSRDLLYKISVPIPPQSEQTKIAEVLSTVDRAIEQTEALISKQQRIKTGLMQDLLTRGIDVHGNLRSEENHEFKDSPLGRIPVKWQAIPISEVGIWYSGATPPKSNGRFWGGEIPWICPKDMKQFELYKSIDTITELAVESGVKLVASGAVIVVIRGMILAHTFPVGYTTADVAFNQDVKAVIERKGLSGRFLAYWLVARSNEFLKLATTATHGTKRFDMEEFQSQPFGLPPAGEQKMIVRIFDDHQKFIDETKGQLAKLQAQKTALMQDLLTGKTRVTPLLEPQDPAAQTP